MRVQLVYLKTKVYIHPTGNKRDNVEGVLYIIKEANEYKLGWTSAEYFAINDLHLQEFENSPNDTTFIDAPDLSSSFSFCVVLNEIYSLQLRSPSPGLWFGSVVIKFKNKEGGNVTILYFHDDESESFKRMERQLQKEFRTFENGEVLWGGIQLINEIQKYCKVEKSNNSGVYLVEVDPVQPEAEDSTKSQQFNFGKFLNDTKWNLLEKLSKITVNSRQNVKKYEKAWMQVAEKNEINDQYDVARIYLTECARIVSDENRRNLIDKETRMKLNKNSSEHRNEFDIKCFRNEEITKEEWESFFDRNGKLILSVNEVKKKIFTSGVNIEAKKQAWLFLLGVYDWYSSSLDRKLVDQDLKKRYQDLKSKWVKDEYFNSQKFKIEKDIARTDRNLEIFKNIGTEDESDISDLKNVNLIQIREILLTFNVVNDKLGYVQGMTDLLSPLFFIIKDDYLVFWSFVKFMDIMERNFLRSQHGMIVQIDELRKLIELMLPNLYQHLVKIDSDNLFFLFRMLLVWFKRELKFTDVLKLWENFWTCYYSSQYQLFFALAILAKNEEFLLKLCGFDEILKYFNDLTEFYDVDELLVISEELFLKFRKTLNYLNKINDGDKDYEILRNLLSTEIVIEKETTKGND